MSVATCAVQFDNLKVAEDHGLQINHAREHCWDVSLLNKTYVSSEQVSST